MAERIWPFALERYISNLSRWNACVRFIQEQGTTYSLLSSEDPGGAEKTADGRFFIVGRREWPQVAELRWLDETLTRFEQDYGLTVLTRARASGFRLKEPFATVVVPRNREWVP